MSRPRTFVCLPKAILLPGIAIGLLCGLLSLAGPACAAQQAVSSGRLETVADFPSQFVPSRDIYVWLPDSYDGERPHAVLYMHDGDNLFDAGTTWNGQEWGVDEVGARLLAAGAVRDFIVVGIPNAGPERAAEYLPQKPFEAMPLAEQEALYSFEHEGIGRVYNGAIRSDAYLRFLVEELKPWVDAHYATLPDRDDTFIMGSSMGGLISVYAISEYPQVFGGAACLSTHWPGSYPGAQAFSQQMQEYLRENLPAPSDHYLWFDFGSEGLDDSYASYQKAVDGILRNAGYDIPHWISYEDVGAGHNEDAWRGRLQYPLTFLLAPRAAPLPVLASVASPDGRSVFSLRINERGEPRYSITRNDEVLIADSRLGLRFRDRPELGQGFALVATERSARDSSWEQPWGERRLVRDHHNELFLQFADDSGRIFGLRVRAFDDGIGFRYEVPAQPGFEGEIDIVDELTEFTVPKQSTAWWIPGRRYNRYEYLYRHGPVEEIEMAHTPMTLRTAAGTHLSLHEAALTDFAAYVLDQRRDRVLQTNLTPWSDGIRVRTQAPFQTPWRTVQVADSAAGLLDSTLILNLNEPNRLGDVSWVQPGKYIGIWWAMHIRKRTWGSGPIHGATTAETERYMDFAAQHGFDGVLVEGWNIGWDGDWFHNGDLFSFTEPYPDFDIEAIAAYGLERGVRLIGHHETSGNVSNYAAQMDAAFDLYQRLGVRQVKTGYVADGGGIKRVDANGLAHYEWHDGQFMVAEYLRSVTEAARRQISINTHEPIKDTGLRRSYPNWLAREGARGQEFNAWGDPGNPPEHEVNLAFTRLLAGPMDYTPGIFDLAPFGLDSKFRPQSTLARQLALYVTIYSPVQMAADLPENYSARPDAFRFIEDVPTDWEQSLGLAGELGDYVVFARRERGGDDWYLGAITDEEARDLAVPLDFLDANRRYTAQIYRDGEGADWRRNPYAIVIEERLVGPGDSLQLWLAPGGGTAIRFRAENE